MEVALADGAWPAVLQLIVISLLVGPLGHELAGHVSWRARYSGLGDGEVLVSSNEADACEIAGRLAAVVGLLSQVRGDFVAIGIDKGRSACDALAGLRI